MTTTITQPKDLLRLVGQDLGISDWLAVPQSDINLFAEATHDQQWIHVDVERATAGPFGGPIAHGYLTLSLLIPLWTQILVIENQGMAVNYGLNRVRFPAPLLSGSLVQASAELTSVEPVAGALQVVMTVTVQAEGAAKPCCVAASVSRLYPADPAG